MGQGDGEGEQRSEKGLNDHPRQHDRFRVRSGPGPGEAQDEKKGDAGEDKSVYRKGPMAEPRGTPSCQDGQHRPRDAPEETPRMYGSARGLRRIA